MSADLAPRTAVDPALESGASHPDARGRRRRAPDWLVALGVGLLTAVLAAIPQWRGTLFYYRGDGHDQFAPLWYVFGQQLRAGHWPIMSPRGWMGGNYAAEGLDAIWNPVSLANDVLVSHLDNLSFAIFVVSAEFLGVLAAGVYLLARTYGASRAPAVVVAVAAPFAGFTLWYAAAGWPGELMSFAWVVHFWWSARRHAYGRVNPLVPFVFGALAVTTGNPYGTVAVALVVVGLAVEQVLARRWRAATGMVITGGCVGALAIAVFLPLADVQTVTNRGTLASVGNDTFLVPRLADLLTSSAPTYLPAITNWSGRIVEIVPSTYLAWFVVPLLPWVRWRRTMATLGRGAASLWVIGGACLLATLGPSNLWLFRWPIRVIEYFYVAVLMVAALALSQGLATDRLRRRTGITAGIVFAGAYLSWAVRPSRHDLTELLGLLLVVVLLAGAGLAWRRGGLRALAAVLVVGTVAVLFLQSSAFPWAPDPLQPRPGPPSPGVTPSYDVARMAAGQTSYRGTVLQLADLGLVTTEQQRDGAIEFGNIPLTTLNGSRDSVVSYTGQGFGVFQNALCMDYRGTVCAQAWDRIWQPTGDGVNIPLVDAMRVSTLVIQRALRPDAAAATPRPGWHVTVRDADHTVWVRDTPLSVDSRVSWTSPGITVTSDRSTDRTESVDYRADSAGRLLFARLAWPGYTAVVDGHSVAATGGPVGLLSVQVPAGAHQLTIRYRPPGLRLGAAAAALAGAVMLVYGVGWAVVRRRHQSRKRPT